MLSQSGSHSDHVAAYRLSFHHDTLAVFVPPAVGQDLLSGKLYGKFLEHIALPDWIPPTLTGAWGYGEHITISRIPDQPWMLRLKLPLWSLMYTGRGSQLEDTARTQANCQAAAASFARILTSLRNCPVDGDWDLPQGVIVDSNQIGAGGNSCSFSVELSPVLVEMLQSRIGFQGLLEGRMEGHMRDALATLNGVPDPTVPSTPVRASVDADVIHVSCGNASLNPEGDAANPLVSHNVDSAQHMLVLLAAISVLDDALDAHVAAS